MTEHEQARAATQTGHTGFRVLLLEDDKWDQVDYAAAMEEIGIEVVGAMSFESLRESLAAGFFDLIVADAFVPPDDRSDYQENRLSDIIDLASGKTPRVPVVALTSRLHFCDIEELTPRLLDFIKKEPAGVGVAGIQVREPACVAFKVLKLCQLLRRLRPSHALPSKMLSVVDADQDLYAAEWVKQSVMDYVRWASLDPANNYLMVSSLQRFSSFISKEIGCATSVFSDAVSTYKEVESFIAAGVPNARGHMRHVLNVYWLGYLVLNVYGLSEKIGRDGAGLNAAWMLAALLHDMALLLEKHGAIVKREHEWTARFPQVSASHAVNAGIMFEVDDMKRVLAGLFADSDKISKLVHEKLGEDDIDHGLHAAYCLLVGATDSQDPRIREAARAIALHNLLGEEGVPTCSMTEEPVAALLAFCDVFQSWDRDRGDKDLAELGIIAETQVSRLSITEDQVCFSVIYPLHPAILPDDDRIPAGEEALVKAIDKHVRCVVNDGLDLTGLTYRADLFFDDKVDPLASFPEKTASRVG